MLVCTSRPRLRLVAALSLAALVAFPGCGGEETNGGAVPAKPVDESAEVRPPDIPAGIATRQVRGKVNRRVASRPASPLRP
ncbi:hypothetical protein EP7_002550 [Isosphaeraceae bacterium EP7]